MPNQLNEARRHKFPKTRYQVKNWGEYNQALQECGSLTVWVTPEAITAWQAPPTGQRGRPPVYSNLAIETGHLLRLAFARPWTGTISSLRDRYMQAIQEKGRRGWERAVGHGQRS